MGSIESGLRKAGVDTAKVKLRAAAEKVLASSKTPRLAVLPFWKAVNADRDMRDALLLDYLERVASDHSSGDDHAHVAAARGEDGTQPIVEPIGGLSHPPDFSEKPVKVAEYRRKLPSERKAAIDVMLRSADAVFRSRLINDKPIGELTYGQLASLVKDSASSAVSHLRLGTEATENAIILDLIAKNGVPSDHSTKVKDLVTPEKLDEFIRVAQIEAPKLIERGMKRTAKMIEERETEHAA
jgi:hypothetical protein